MLDVVRCGHIEYSNIIPKEYKCIDTMFVIQHRESRLLYHIITVWLQHSNRKQNNNYIFTESSQHIIFPIYFGFKGRSFHSYHLVLHHKPNITPVDFFWYSDQMFSIEKLVMLYPHAYLVRECLIIILFYSDGDVTAKKPSALMAVNKPLPSSCSVFFFVANHQYKSTYHGMIHDIVIW